MTDEIELQTAITPTPIPTVKSLVPAASSPIQFPAPASDVDYAPFASGTANSTGTTSLVMSAVSGKITIGSTVLGAGVPAGTKIISGPAAGGNGTYTTNVATTLTAIAVTFDPARPIEPGGNTPPIVVNPATYIPGEPLSKQNAGHNYILALPTFRGPPLIVLSTTFNQSGYPPFGATGFPYNATDPPMLPFNRTPPFPAYPT